jgi:hypothetical protein
VALGAAALAIFLAVRIRHDVRYALSSSTPRDLGPAEVLARGDAAALPVNQYVQVSGRPDRASGVILDTQGSWEFRQLFRLSGTDSRVFVRRQGDPLPVALAEKPRYTGRLIPFSDLSFFESIREHFAARVSGTHFFEPARLAGALEGGGAAPGALTVPDRTGGQVKLGPGDELVIERERPGRFRVELPRDRFPGLAQAKETLEAKGATVVAEVPGVDPRAARDRLVVEVEIPAAAREPILSALGDLDRRVRLRPARQRDVARLRELSTHPGLLVITRTGAPAVELPLGEIVSLRTEAPVVIPKDALILLEGERPRDQLPKLVILAFLVAFTAVSAMGLRRRAA